MGRDKRIVRMSVLIATIRMGFSRSSGNIVHDYDILFMSLLVATSISLREGCLIPEIQADRFHTGYVVLQR